MQSCGIGVVGTPTFIFEDKVARVMQMKSGYIN